MPNNSYWSLRSHLKCAVIKPLPAKIKISHEYFFLNLINPIKRLIIYNEIDDMVCIDQIFIIEIECVEIDGLKIKLDIERPKIYLKILNDTPYLVCDDPHFSQIVIGTDEDGKLLRKRICYNTFGRAGEKYELIYDKFQSN